MNYLLRMIRTVKSYLAFSCGHLSGILAYVFAVCLAIFLAFNLAILLAYILSATFWTFFLAVGVRPLASGAGSGAGRVTTEKEGEGAFRKPNSPHLAAGE